VEAYYKEKGLELSADSTQAFSSSSDSTLPDATQCLKEASLPARVGINYSAIPLLTGLMKESFFSIF
jgi:hypothetical protein